MSLDPPPTPVFQVGTVKVVIRNNIYPTDSPKTPAIDETPPPSAPPVSSEE